MRCILNFPAFFLPPCNHPYPSMDVFPNDHVKCYACWKDTSLMTAAPLAFYF